MKHGKTRFRVFTYSVSEKELRKNARRMIDTIRLVIAYLAGRRLRQIFRDTAFFSLRQHRFDSLDQFARCFDA